MASTPNAAFSVRLRVQIPNKPGELGRIATAIGQAGGNIAGLDIVEVAGGSMVRDVTVLASDEDHVGRIRAALEGLENVTLVSATDRTFELHEGGKIEVGLRSSLLSRDDLSMAYTPGVARVCTAIQKDPDLAHRYTIRSNTVAVVTDGTAVLGLGDIGPLAALPVMEGKAMLFKEFGGIDAFPVCLDVSSSDQLVEAVTRIAPVYGGINLEDVAAPRCFEVEERLKAVLDIPVFHDDQHGTAVVVLAALRNALKVVDRKIEDLSVVIAGAGAAGVAIAKILLEAGVGSIVGVDRRGAIHRGRQGLDLSKQWLADHTNVEGRQGSLTEVLAGADLFVGVSGPGLLNGGDLAVMRPDPIVFALANPDPEVAPEEAEGVAAVVATGRSDYPNQINNVLCFPGIFRGALDAGATDITENMKLAAAEAIASVVDEDQLSPSYIVPSVFDKRVAPAVAEAVAAAARADRVTRPEPLRPA
ncbi:MAG TPA: NAD-dependent malic enzyme [Acidimicrobiales bacterium]|nr:NAD-dependent malic enzyme [Acidimicrobiales bacterium]